MGSSNSVLIQKVESLEQEVQLLRSEIRSVNKQLTRKRHLSESDGEEAPAIRKRIRIEEKEREKIRRNKHYNSIY